MQMFSVGVTADLLGLWNKTGLDPGRQLMLSNGIALKTLPAIEELTPADLDPLDALLLLKPTVTSRSIVGVDKLKLIARWGVGLDNVDVDRCTDAGVLISVAPDGVKRPMAISILTFILALSTNLMRKHRLMEAGKWDRALFPGRGLTGKVLGLVGFGNIGRELVKISAPLDVKFVVYDPYTTLVPTNVELLALDELMARADYVCVCCPLTEETRGLIDERRLALMQPTSCFVNVSRGPIVDEGALIDALTRRAIAGAALDVFEQEPLPSESPLRKLDNVLLAPHSIGWTDELIKGNDLSSAHAIIAYAAKQVPQHLANPDALNAARQRRWFRD